MALYLVQHGKAVPKDQDPDEPLSDQGSSEVEDIAQKASEKGIQLELIEHSPKLRAKQTAEIFEKYANPGQGIREREGIKAKDDVSLLANEISSDQDLMLVGHLPFMEKLTSYLLTGQTEQRVVKFQNGGIVAMDKDSDSGAWMLKATLFPYL